MEFSFKILKLIFGNNFEERAELVSEYFSTVFSHAEPRELTTFQAWMLGS